jgi:hypothetical protein
MSVTKREIQTSLRTPAKRIAAQAIENVHLEYYEKGGIRETAEKLATQLESASRHVYSLAIYAAKNTTDLVAAGRLFVEMCNYAEDTYKVEHEVDNLRDALPTWATYKSNVLRGIRAGLNPLEHKSEKAFRSKTMEQISRSRQDVEAVTAELEDARAGPPKLRGEDEIEEFVGTTTVADPLKQLVAQVVYAAEIVKPAMLEQAEEILREAWQKLGALTDKRRMRAGGGHG